MSVPIKDLLDLVVARGGGPSSLLDLLMARGGGLSVLREVEEWTVSKRAVLAAAPPALPAASALAALQEYEDEADVLRGGGGGAPVAKKRSGRPPKGGAAAALEDLAAAPAPPAGEKKRRGRPPKSGSGTEATTSTLATAAAVVLDGEETEPEEEARGAGGAAGSSASSVVGEEKKVRFKWSVFLKELRLTEGRLLRFRARDQGKKEHTVALPLISTEDGLALSYEGGEPGGPTPVAAAIKTAIGNFRPDAQHAKKGVNVPASGHKDWEMEHAGKWYRLADPIWNGLIWDAGRGAFVARA
jgi:hypothetical protein